MSDNLTVKVDTVKEAFDLIPIGTFDFAEGTDGFGEIPAADSTGLVLADTLRFLKVPSVSKGSKQFQIP